MNMMIRPITLFTLNTENKYELEIVKTIGGKTQIWVRAYFGMIGYLNQCPERD